MSRLVSFFSFLFFFNYLVIQHSYEVAMGCGLANSSLQTSLITITIII